MSRILDRCDWCGERGEGPEPVLNVFICDTCLNEISGFEAMPLLDPEQDEPADPACYEGGDHVMDGDTGLCIYCGCSENALL